MDIRKYARIFLNIAVPLMTIYLICVWGPRLLGFFIPFVIGWVVAMIANPLVRFLEKKIRIVRRHSSMVLIVGVLALVIFGLYFLGSRGLKEMVLFVRALPGLYAGGPGGCGRSLCGAGAGPYVPASGGEGLLRSGHRAAGSVHRRLSPGPGGLCRRSCGQDPARMCWSIPLWSFCPPICSWRSMM